ncbi:MAG: MotA/TolQ/ExbB proton channel family protein [Fusobacteriaceae bacterium]
MYWIQAGGPLMYAILLCSIVSLGVAIERFMYLKVNEANSFQRIKEILAEHLEKKEVKEAVYLLSRSRSSSSQVVKELIIYWYKTGTSNIITLEEKSKELILRQIPKIDRNVWLLSLIANIATLLGLLGTVLGMILTFKSVSEGGIGDPAILMSSISVALITTAGGLSVAIPTIIFYHTINRRVDTVISEMETACTEVINFFRK